MASYIYYSWELRACHWACILICCWGRCRSIRVSGIDVDKVALAQAWLTFDLQGKSEAAFTKTSLSSRLATRLLVTVWLESSSWDLQHWFGVHETEGQHETGVLTGTCTHQGFPQDANIWVGCTLMCLFSFIWNKPSAVNRFVLMADQNVNERKEKRRHSVAPNENNNIWKY